MVIQNPLGMGEFLNLSWLYFQGPVIVAGTQAHELVHHPHVFQKRDTDLSVGLLTVCYHQTCSSPFSSPEEAESLVKEKIKFYQVS